ncbi:MAG: MurR/RpiR family transcriptional regulator [Metamycoplasmataceae bacterium]
MNYKILDVSNKKLNASEIYVVDKINEDPKLFTMSSIIELSKIYYISKSSLSRLVRKIGFNNVFEMKIFIQKEITKHENIYSIKVGEDTKTRINNLMSYSNFGINETLLNIDVNNFSKIAKIIKKSNRVLSFGIGSSFLAAQELSNNLQKIGINISSCQDIHNAILKISNFNENDLILVFSKSGETEEVIFLLKAAKELNSKTVIITVNEKIKENIDYKILLKDLGKEKRIIATSSKISQLLIADALFMEINYLLKTKTEEYLNKSLVFLSEWKNRK